MKAESKCLECLSPLTHAQQESTPCRTADLRHADSIVMTEEIPNFDSIGGTMADFGITNSSFHQSSSVNLSERKEPLSKEIPHNSEMRYNHLTISVDHPSSKPKNQELIEMDKGKPQVREVTSLVDAEGERGKYESDYQGISADLLLEDITTPFLASLMTDEVSHQPSFTEAMQKMPQDHETGGSRTSHNTVLMCGLPDTHSLLSMRDTILGEDSGIRQDTDVDLGQIRNSEKGGGWIEQCNDPDPCFQSPTVMGPPLCKEDTVAFPALISSPGEEQRGELKQLSALKGDKKSSATSVVIRSIASQINCNSSTESFRFPFGNVLIPQKMADDHGDRRCSSASTRTPGSACVTFTDHDGKQLNAQGTANEKLQKSNDGDDSAVCHSHSSMRMMTSNPHIVIISNGGDTTDTLAGNPLFHGNSPSYSVCPTHRSSNILCCADSMYEKMKLSPYSCSDIGSGSTSVGNCASPFGSKRVVHRKMSLSCGMEDAYEERNKSRERQREGSFFFVYPMHSPASTAAETTRLSSSVLPTARASSQTPVTLSDTTSTTTVDVRSCQHRVRKAQAFLSPINTHFVPDDGYDDPLSRKCSVAVNYSKCNELGVSEKRRSGKSSSSVALTGVAGVSGLKDDAEMDDGMPSTPSQGERPPALSSPSTSELSSNGGSGQVFRSKVGQHHHRRSSRIGTSITPNDMLVGHCISSKYKQQSKRTTINDNVVILECGGKNRKESIKRKGSSFCVSNSSFSDPTIALAGTTLSLSSFSLAHPARLKGCAFPDNEPDAENEVKQEQNRKSMPRPSICVGTTPSEFIWKRKNLLCHHHVYEQKPISEIERLEEEEGQGANKHESGQCGDEPAWTENENGRKPPSSALAGLVGNNTGGSISNWFCCSSSMGSQQAHDGPLGSSIIVSFQRSCFSTPSSSSSSSSRTSSSFSFEAIEDSGYATCATPLGPLVFQPCTTHDVILSLNGSPLSTVRMPSFSAYEGIEVLPSANKLSSIHPVSMFQDDSPSRFPKKSRKGKGQKK